MGSVPWIEGDGESMARQQVNVRLSGYTIAQLKDLANRFDMSESTVIMLAIDRLARDSEQGKSFVLEGDEGVEEATTQKKGGLDDGNHQATRARRGHNHAAKRR
jgi:hypothetical protein